MSGGSVSNPAPAAEMNSVTSSNSLVIEMHVRDVHQLFDILDPSPFRQRDLNRSAEEYIRESVREAHKKLPPVLVLHVDQVLGGSEEERFLGDAVRGHFSRLANLLRKTLSALIHRGLISLAIGTAFLAAVFSIAQLVAKFLGEGAFATLLREGLMIFGWVAMWRPLEIFLYDWWPIWGDRKLYDRLSQMEVRVVHPAVSPGPVADPAP